MGLKGRFAVGTTPSLFEFEWFVDQDGYELVGEVVGIWPETTLPVIRPKGGTLRGYRPLEEFPGLVRRLANLPRNENGKVNPDDILEFANEFGLLTALVQHRLEKDYWPSEALVVWESAVTSANGIVKKIDKGEPPRNVAELFNALPLPPVPRRAPFTEIHPVRDPYEPPEPTFSVRIDPDDRGRLSMRVAPLKLLSALWLQLAGEITDGTTFKECEQCPNWFPVGPGTGHKRTKRFCETRCRVAWNRMKEKSR